MAAVRTQIYLTSEQRRRIDDLLEREGGSLAGVVRRALDRYLDAEGVDETSALEVTFGAEPAIDVPSREEWLRGRPVA